MSKESYYLSKMTENGCDRVTRYYGDGHVNNAMYIVIEHIDMTLEAYFADPAIPEKRSI